jgi:hypothetical protein
VIFGEGGMLRKAICQGSCPYGNFGICAIFQVLVFIIVKDFTHIYICIKEIVVVEIPFVNINRSFLLPESYLLLVPYCINNVTCGKSCRTALDQ